MSLGIKTGDKVALKDGQWTVVGTVKALHVVDGNTWADVIWNTPNQSPRVSIKKLKKA